MIDVGWLGSPIDVATFIVATVVLVYEVRPDVDALAAAVVALARVEDNVDGDRVQSDLDVEDRDVRAYQRPVADGGSDGR